ncbi:MAG: GAF domain-containing protein [Burkholderiales bacterium]|nr:GAF domain-containing protein [Anaerolineae bacterium]
MATPTLLETLERLKNNVGELESSLNLVLRALEKRGLQLSVDVDGMAQKVRVETEAAEKQAQRMNAQLEQLQGFMHTAALINSTLRLDAVLEGVIDTIIHLTRAERVYIMLVDENDGELRVRAARNWEQVNVTENDMAVSTGIAQSAMTEGKPILTTNAQADARFQSNKSVVRHGLRSILVAPLLRRDKAIGVLYADNRIEQGIFNEDTVPLLTAFADQAAIAIENARLFARVKADLDEAQREVARLRIEVDRSKLDTQVGEIVESEYFQQLAQLAKGMRKGIDNNAEESAAQ